MENVIIPGSPLPTIGITSTPVSVQAFNFSECITKLKNDGGNNGLKSAILLKSSEKQIVLTALQKGTQISSFQSSRSVTFNILEGNLKFQSRNKTVNLSNGQLLVLNENIKYSLTSHEDSVLLITIAGNILQTKEN